MPTATLQDARTAVVRERVLDAVAELLERGEDLTFAKLAKEAAVPERTLYRHFPTRSALMAAVFVWANERIGFSGIPPADGVEATRLVRRAFPGFEQMAPVIRELLVSTEGLEARLTDIDRRRRASIALIQHEVPGLDRATTRRVAATIQLLCAAGTWQTLHDYWSMDGKEAGETAALAIDLVLDAARARAKAPAHPAKASSRKSNS